MLFSYKAVDEQGANKEGQIDAPSRDMAISGLQRRGFIIVSIEDADKKKSLFKMTFFEKVPLKDIVILSRQISTLFEAQVSALKVFSMLATSARRPILIRKLNQITDDLQAGFSISGALSKHPDLFSNFYVNMVKAGEETGKLNQTFLQLAEYLDRQYTLTTKTRNALIYPIFVIFTFFVVMTLMLVLVIPKLSAIITESGQEIPFYTKIVISASDIFVNYGFLFLIFIILFGIWVWRFSRTDRGKADLDRTQLSVPLLGDLYRRLYLSRIADNLDTMISSGVPMVRAIDITAEVVGSRTYRQLMKEVADGVKSGVSLSAAFEKYPVEVPVIMVQMVKVGEESGSLGSVLKTLGAFYKREVDDAIDTMVGLIEPAMIVVLGLGVGILLVSILLPIYNLAGGIS
ncbi:type II secretion system F family protein [Candidatus Nomurabacteria bacterium]|nr:type II secretion system F family protein [Candidatus Nomurabacteria bacterium]